MTIFHYFAILLIGLLPLVPAMIFFHRKRRSDFVNASKKLFLGLSGANVLVGLAAFAVGLIWLMTPEKAQAAQAAQTAAAGGNLDAIGAALSTGLAAIASGYAVSNTGSAAIGAISEKPELFGQSLIFVGLAEGIAIYGMLISFLILNR
jgi:V/A-type H+-transporting ATPase subunit K